MKNQTRKFRDYQMSRTKIEPGFRELNPGITPCDSELVFSNTIKTLFAREYMLKETLISVERAIGISPYTPYRTCSKYSNMFFNLVSTNYAL